jgi:Zn-dependent protease
MMPTRNGAFRLFRLAGVDVFLHWSWFAMAFYEVNLRREKYSSLTWNVLEYLALFAIVLMHEFGHALACRQVGGQADQIILWPLGGVAYVSPPQRPGAMLWSIAAGPLVNVALAPIFTVLALVASRMGWEVSLPNAYTFARAVFFMNCALLIFNLLPVYPLDGGQILRSLLWFGFGRARSLMIATVIGFAGVVGLLALAVAVRSLWTGVIAVFILLNCWRGLMHARVLTRVAQLARRPGFLCPSCRMPPVLGPIWRCDKCLKPFDTFATNAVCPHCGKGFPSTACLDCGVAHPISEWVVAPPFPAPAPASPPG